MKQFWQNKKVLITGAGGFVGYHLCRMLLEKRADITAIARNPIRLNQLKDQIKIKNINLANPDQTKNLITDEEIIIHQAAVDGGSQFKKEHAHQIFHDNTLININVLEAVRNKRVKKFIYVSSAEVYHPLKIPRKIREEDFRIFTPDKPELWYPFSKVLGETAVKIMGMQTGVKTLIIRPANIYGPGDSNDKKRLVPLILQAISEHKEELILKGNGQGIRTFIYLDDYLQNFLDLITSDCEGTFNLAGINQISIRDFADIFSRLAGLKIIFENKMNDKKTDDYFVLDIQKIIKTIPDWKDRGYEPAIKELIN